MDRSPWWSIWQVETGSVRCSVLWYFDTGSKVTLESDSSEAGLGCVLLQKGQPVAYASCRLTKAERNYAMIEKELLSILYGMTKFHQFTYGRKVVVGNDHRALEIITKKSLHKAPKQLQRMFLNLGTNDYEICYKKGKHMYIVDTLSRAYLTKDKATSLEEVIR